MGVGGDGMEANIRTKVTQERPGAARFFSCSHHGLAERADMTPGLEEEPQDLDCVCFTQVKQDQLGMEGRL